jgi:hypothetical protein
MLSRRSFIGIAAAMLVPRAAPAAQQCDDAEADGRQRCVVGLDVGPIETVRQRCENWCWAACIQTVFALNGHDVAQESAVAKLFGSEACEGATMEGIIAAIDGEWIDAIGNRFTAEAQELPLAWMGVSASGGGAAATDTTGLAIEGAMKALGADGIAALVDELPAGHALIIGALGHATVVTAASYTRSAGGVVSLDRLVVRDPWPDSDNRRVLTPDEVRDAFFVVKVAVRG